MSGMRLPSDAFEYYFCLGDGRSYATVAEHYGVAKKTVTRRAVTEDWQRLVDEREQEVRKRVREKAVETLEQLNERHLKMLRVVQRKALDALKSFSITDAMKAVRALDMSIKQERLVLGEPTDRSASELAVTSGVLVAPAEASVESWIDDQELLEESRRRG